jgi:hypothetical protein
MNAHFLNNRFSEGRVVDFPILSDWRKLEFFAFAEYLIKSKRFHDHKYTEVITLVAMTDLNVDRQTAVEFVKAYIALVSKEAEDLLKFKERFSKDSTIVQGIELYDEYGSKGMKMLFERRFISRTVLNVERVLSVSENSNFDFSTRLNGRIELIGPHARLVKGGYVILKKRPYFGANLSKDHLFFLWVLSVVVEPEEYAVRFLANKNLRDLDRSFMSFMRKSGGVHQTMVKLTRDIKSSIRRFEQMS